MSIKFICLANSIKEGGRCLAGIEVSVTNRPIMLNGKPKWIRPICDTLHGKIPIYIAAPFKILDIVSIAIIGSKPEGHQSENVTFSNNSLKKVGLCEKKQVLELCESCEYIFGTDDDSLSEDEVLDLDHSLLLIRATTFKVITKSYEGKTKHRLQFDYNGITYNFSITDPVFLDKYRADSSILEDLDEIGLCLSVGVKFLAKNRYYKLIAGVIY